MSDLSASRMQSLALIKQAIPLDLRTEFEAAFESWKQTWFRGGLAMNSNPEMRGVGMEYDALISLGSEIIPLVIEKLVEADNFMALQLYDAIQTDEQLVLPSESDDDLMLEGEQGRARRVVEAWALNMSAPAA